MLIDEWNYEVISFFLNKDRERCVSFLCIFEKNINKNRIRFIQRNMIFFKETWIFFLIIEKDACRFYAYLKKILIKIGWRIYSKKNMMVNCLSMLEEFFFPITSKVFRCTYCILCSTSPLSIFMISSNVTELFKRLRLNEVDYFRLSMNKSLGFFLVLWNFLWLKVAKRF